jgi:hypothetical protein
MAKIAMFLARSPNPPMTGRKAVIHTALTALAEQGHDVDLFILAKSDTPPGQRSGVFWLGTVPKVRMLCNVALSILGGTRSLNEALFQSRSLLARARGLRGAYDFAIADTVRAAQYAHALGVPWHLDLDDLFSARYEAYLERPEELSAAAVLGYYRDRVPRAVSALSIGVLARLLRIEAVRLRRREVYWARMATTVSLVSPDEAGRFATMVSRPVQALPMSVRVPKHPWTPANANGGRGVFLGGLDYKPNMDALLHYQEQIFPALKRQSGVPSIQHIGHSPSELREKFLPDVVSFEGYVEDVVSRLSRAAFFIAPIVSGTGIKTKVLEAMAVGLPVLATRDAVSGLKVEHRKHCFICQRTEDFIEGMRYVSNPRLAAEMGLAARRYVRANFSMDVLARRWRDVIHELAFAAGRPGTDGRRTCSTA